MSKADRGRGNMACRTRQSSILLAAAEDGSHQACLPLRRIRSCRGAGADADPGARRRLQHQPTTTCPARIAASDRRASTAGAGKLAPDGQLHRPVGRHRAAVTGTEPRESDRWRDNQPPYSTLLPNSLNSQANPADLQRRADRGADQPGDQQRTSDPGADSGGRDIGIPSCCTRPISTSCAIRLSCRSTATTLRCCGSSSRQPRIDFGSAK